MNIVSQAEKTRIWRKANPEKVKAQKQRNWQRIKNDPLRHRKKNARQSVYHDNNKEQRLADHRARQYYKQKPEYWRQYSLRKRFGLSLSDYDSLMANQNAVCAICEQPESCTRGQKTSNLSVDHCHKSGTVRGLLCRQCNSALGLFGDSIEMLEAAIDYLKQSTKRKGV